MHATRLVHQAWLVDIDLMLQACQECWSFHFLSALQPQGIIESEAWRPGSTEVIRNSIVALHITREQGKLQLAKDLGELQLAIWTCIGQGLFPLDAMGPVNRCLRGFRAMSFTDDDALATAACLRDVPAAPVLQHCFMISRLPQTVQTPAERSGVSPAQYSRWLDQHSAADVARSVASALEAAKADVAAAEASSPGTQAVIVLMRQLSGME